MFCRLASFVQNVENGRRNFTLTAGGWPSALAALGSGSFGPKWEIALSSSGDRAEEAKAELIHAKFIFCS
jgi:hypothetical protein